ncbi:P-loop containing nucleoside triphosphate hydrolase protein [Cantharellus anzutake]|uniref:P-loop containing nucleoside triphosphate hydrolase protein n=1 Tax=Cantharellus anzutake TaxID=1750568 RepID=UPI0019036F19|nr:P-loop containing nucleoside triphosphate hydrolase protein [Cantharellus anzutake]KAF8343993.1 P-loop containing nucleoside triphosphate hydrolase protein [Cantharellus anzutake]
MRPNVVLPAKEVPVTPDKTKYCIKCDREISSDNWETHSVGRPHQRAEEFYTLRQKLEVEAPRNFDVTIDYGIIEPKKTTDIAIHLRLTVPGSVRLLDFRMDSASGKHIFSKETHFKPETWRGVIHYGESHGFLLQFNSHGVVGKFEDRAILEFINDDGVQFHVVKDVVAQVGNREELESLAPKEKYKPPPVRDPEELRSVIMPAPEEKPKGPKPEVSLKQFSVPPALRHLLRMERNPLLLRHAFRNDFLPVGQFELEASDLELGSESAEVIPDLDIVRGLDVTTYPQLWSSLLHVEEVVLQLDITRYDMDSQFLESRGDKYMVIVPGLLEKRPSIILGDLIEVRKMNHPSGPWFQGRVEEVERERVHLKFHENFGRQHIEGMQYEVHFKLNRSSLRRMHQAMSIQVHDTRLIYPAINHVYGHVPELPSPGWFNRDIQNNLAQQRAVLMVMYAPRDSIPLLIHGPPGTGKTIAVVESVLQCLQLRPDSRILVCAPSNPAADLIVTRLKKHLKKSVMFRLNALARPILEVRTDIQEYSKMNAGRFEVPPLEELKKFRVIVSTCISASRLYAVGMTKDHFEWIFVDEAAQGFEPEVMVPLRTLAGSHTRVILSGDPLQLGPIVRSFLGRRFGLERSLFERLIAMPPYDVEEYTGRTIVTLSQNYRSHPAILKFPSDQFYGKKLEACGDPLVTQCLSQWSELPKSGFPIIFHAVKGEDKREGRSPSWFNPTEVSVVVGWVKKLRLEKQMRSDDYIGVISPYKAQCQKIRTIINSPLLKGNRTGKLRVDSVEGFQGQERRAIIISCVRSNTNYVKEDMRASLGFVANQARFNVAVTRAQALLIVVGDPVVLSLDPLWRSFMDYVHENGGWTGMKKDWGGHAPRTTGLPDFLQARKQDDSLPTAELHEDQLNGTDAEQFAAAEALRAEEYHPNVWTERE